MPPAPSKGSMGSGPGGQSEGAHEVADVLMPLPFESHTMQPPVHASHHSTTSSKQGPSAAAIPCVHALDLASSAPGLDVAVNPAATLGLSPAAYPSANVVPIPDLYLPDTQGLSLAVNAAASQVLAPPTPATQNPNPPVFNNGNLSATAATAAAAFIAALAAHNQQGLVRRIPTAPHTSQSSGQQAQATATTQGGVPRVPTPISGYSTVESQVSAQQYQAAAAARTQAQQAVQGMALLNSLSALNGQRHLIAIATAQQQMQQLIKQQQGGAQQGVYPEGPKQGQAMSALANQAPNPPSQGNTSKVEAAPSNLQNVVLAQLLAQQLNPQQQSLLTATHFLMHHAQQQQHHQVQQQQQQQHQLQQHQQQQRSAAGVNGKRGAAGGAPARKRSRGARRASPPHKTSPKSAASGTGDVNDECGPGRLPGLQGTGAPGSQRGLSCDKVEGAANAGGPVQSGVQANGMRSHHFNSRPVKQEQLLDPKSGPMVPMAPIPVPLAMQRVGDLWWEADGLSAHPCALIRAYRLRHLEQQQQVRQETVAGMEGAQCAAGAQSDAAQHQNQTCSGTTSTACAMDLTHTPAIFEGPRVLVSTISGSSDGSGAGIPSRSSLADGATGSGGGSASAPPVAPAPLPPSPLTSASPSAPLVPTSSIAPSAVSPAPWSPSPPTSTPRPLAPQAPTVPHCVPTQRFKAPPQRRRRALLKRLASPLCQAAILKTLGIGCVPDKSAQPARQPCGRQSVQAAQGQVQHLIQGKAGGTPPWGFRSTNTVPRNSTVSHKAVPQPSASLLGATFVPSFAPQRPAQVKFEHNQLSCRPVGLGGAVGALPKSGGSGHVGLQGGVVRWVSGLGGATGPAVPPRSRRKAIPVRAAD